MSEVSEVSTVSTANAVHVMLSCKYNIRDSVFIRQSFKLLTTKPCRFCRGLGYITLPSDYRHVECCKCSGIGHTIDSVQQYQPELGTITRTSITTTQDKQTRACTTCSVKYGVSRVNEASLTNRVSEANKFLGYNEIPKEMLFSSYDECKRSCDEENDILLEHYLKLNPTARIRKEKTLL